MNKREELILKYENELKEKLKMDVDSDLLTKVTVGLGPSIYNADSSIVSSSDEKELATVKQKFLIEKLGLSDADALDEAIDSVMELYGKANRKKYRAVVYYVLVKHFGKEDIYN